MHLVCKFIESDRLVRKTDWLCRGIGGKGSFARDRIGFSPQVSMNVLTVENLLP